MSRTTPIKYTKGMKFNKLTLIEYIPKTKLWKCLCECGKTTYARAHTMKIGRHKSCGCINSEGRKRLPNNLGPIRELYRKYEAAAIRRNYTFNLTENEFSNLIKSNCHYCGIEPNTTRTMYTKKYLERKFTYNGIDRINNKLGYTKSNVVSCCHKCNNSKSVFTIEEWKLWIKRLYNKMFND